MRNEKNIYPMIKLMSNIDDTIPTIQQNPENCGPQEAHVVKDIQLLRNKISNYLKTLCAQRVPTVVFLNGMTANSTPVVIVSNPYDADICVNMVSKPYNTSGYKYPIRVVNQISEATHVFQLVPKGTTGATKIYLYGIQKKNSKTLAVKYADNYYKVFVKY